MALIWAGCRSAAHRGIALRRARAIFFSRQWFFLRHATLCNGHQPVHTGDHCRFRPDHEVEIVRSVFENQVGILTTPQRLICRHDVYRPWRLIAICISLFSVKWPAGSFFIIMPSAARRKAWSIMICYICRKQVLYP